MHLRFSLTWRLCRDAFAGGFVAGIVEGKPLEECIDMGHWLASLSIKELGPQYVYNNPLTHTVVTLDYHNFVSHLQWIPNIINHPTAANTLK